MGALKHHGRMHSTGGATDHDLKQRRLARFGLVLALIAFGVIVVNALLSLWLPRDRHDGTPPSPLPHLG
jgi:hypothetical protein